MKSLAQYIYFFCPALIAFILPFGNALSSPFIGIWFLAAIVLYKEYFNKEGLKNRYFRLLLVFFGITLLSNFLFYNANDPFSEVEVKLSFLFLPVTYFLFQLPPKIAQRVLGAFVSGCHFACLFCLGRGFYYLLQGTSDNLYYSSFSWFMHSSYFAMFLNLSLILVIYFYFTWFKHSKLYRAFSVYLVFLFILCITLCASKIGLIVLFVVTPILLVYNYRKNISLKSYLISALLLIAFVFFIFQFNPRVFDRLRSMSVVTSQNIDITSEESSAVRVLIWGECLELIKKNMLVGTGVSKTNQRLYEAYQEKGYTGALKNKLNAHNQYFQTFIGLGIIGFLVLILLTLGVVVKAYKEKSYPLFFFGILMVLNFFVESMLQTSTGTVFFVFFLCFFLVFNSNKLKNEQTLAVG